MKKSLFFFLIGFIIFSANAQTALRLTIPQYGLRLDSVPFEIIRVADKTENPRYCGYFESRAGRKTPYYLKGGIAKRFESYFRKADYGAKLGEHKLMASFNKLHVIIKNEKGKKGVQVNQEMDIDFYEIGDNGKLRLIMNFQQIRDTSITNMDFNLKKSTYPMMQNAYQQLTDYYLNNDNKAVEENAFVEEAEIESQDELELNDQEFQSLSEIPETKRLNLLMDIISYEQFYSSKLVGYRGRYGIAFKNDTAKWLPFASFGFEVLDLKENFDGSDGVYDVALGYFGIGFGSLRRFDDALGLELNGTIIYGSEQVSRDPFLREYSSSTLFGLHLVERLHVFVGMEGGLVITGGFFQNFNGGSKYVPTDFGYLWGVGIHF